MIDRQVVDALPVFDNQLSNAFSAFCKIFPDTQIALAILDQVFEISELLDTPFSVFPIGHPPRT